MTTTNKELARVRAARVAQRAYNALGGLSYSKDAVVDAYAVTGDVKCIRDLTGHNFLPGEGDYAQFYSAGWALAASMRALDSPKNHNLYGMLAYHMHDEASELAASRSVEEICAMFRAAGFTDLGNETAAALFAAYIMRKTEAHLAEQLSE